MAHLYRLIAFFLVVWPSFAHAVIPAISGNEYSVAPNTIVLWHSSKLSACTAYADYQTSLQTDGSVLTVNAQYSSGGICYADRRLPNGTLQQTYSGAPYSTRSAYSCPANATLASTTCQCNSGYTENSDSTSCLPVAPPCDPPNVLRDGVCGPPDPPKCNYPPGAGMPDTLFQMGGGANYKGGYICYLNCEAVPDMRGQKDGKWFHWGPYTSTGATCANSTGDSTGGQPTPDNPDGVPPPPDPDAPPRDPPPPPPEPPPEQCKKGTCPGSINGTTVCMPCQEARSPQPVPGAPPKAPPTPPDPTGNNAPPETQKTTQSATNCKDGKCTTTTTTSTTDANGVTTTNSNSKTESKDDFCTTNPRSSMCIDGAFGGACSGGFVCEGDAVQCAMAKEQHARNCKLFEDFDGVEAQLYESEKGKDGSVIGDVPGGSTHAFGAASFDSSDALNAGMGGPQDRSVTVMGQTLLLKFSAVTPYLAMLGNLLLAISFLIAARIFLRG